MVTETRWQRAQRFLVIPSVILVQFLFGGNSVVSKVALGDGVDPVIFGFLRDVIASPIMMTAAVLLDGRPVIRREDHFFTFLLGLFLYGNQLFYILGVDNTTSVNAALLQPSIPAFTLLLSLALGIERLAWRHVDGWLKLVGIAAAITGSILVNVLKDPGSDQSSNPIMGNIFLVFNCLSFACYSILNKTFVDRYPPTRVAAWAYVAGTLCMGLSVLGCSSDCSARWNLPLNAYWALAYTAILCSALSYALLAWANKMTSPMLVTAFWPLQVLASVLLSAIFLDYTLQTADLIGGIVISVGLIAVVAGKVVGDRRERAHTEARDALLGAGSDAQQDDDESDGDDDNDKERGRRYGSEDDAQERTMPINTDTYIKTKGA